MRVAPVDPRDTIWEDDAPAYRVYFWTSWKADSTPTSDEWRAVNAEDVGEVIAWAEANRNGRTFELFVEHEDARETRDGWVLSPGLIRLAGVNPVEDTTPTSLPFRQTHIEQDGADAKDHPLG